MGVTCHWHLLAKGMKSQLLSLVVHAWWTKIKHWFIPLQSTLLIFNWQTCTLIQAKEQSAGNINIEGRAKNDDLWKVHFWERKEEKQTDISNLQSTITFWVVPYTFASVAISDSLLTLLFTLFSDKHTTNLIEAVAVYTNKIQKLKTLIKLSNLCNL